MSNETHVFTGLATFGKPTSVVDKDGYYSVTAVAYSETEELNGDVTDVELTITIGSSSYETTVRERIFDEGDLETIARDRLHLEMEAYIQTSSMVEIADYA